MERLIAMQRIVHSVSTIDVGQEFVANVVDADRYVQERAAYRAAGPVPPWDLYWPAASVVCIASGPSLTREDCEMVHAWRKAENGTPRRVIVINTSFLLAPWADVLYACDVGWWKNYYLRATHEFAAGKEAFWTQDVKAKDEFGINCVTGVNQPGLNRKRGFINNGNNGGYQVVGLAYQARAKRIILLGYDMSAHQGQEHWHPEHPWIANPHATSLPRRQYARWIQEFFSLAKDLEQEGVQVVNATRRTALKWFPMQTLEEALYATV